MCLLRTSPKVQVCKVINGIGSKIGKRDGLDQGCTCIGAIPSCGWRPVYSCHLRQIREGFQAQPHAGISRLMLCLQRCQPCTEAVDVNASGKARPEVSATARGLVQQRLNEEILLQDLLGAAPRGYFVQTAACV